MATGDTDERAEQDWAAAAGAATGHRDRLVRDGTHLVRAWNEGADAIEELSKIENGGETSETVQGAAAQLRRCATQLSSVLATPLALATEIGAVVEPSAVTASDVPAPPASPSQPSGK